MRGLTLLAAVLVLAAPARAQTYVWNADRPDGVAPVGIAVDRPVQGRTLRASYRFSRTESRGLKTFSGPLLEAAALELGFKYVPIQTIATSHSATIGIGINDQVTLMVTGGWVSKAGEVANDSVFFFENPTGVLDPEADVLWQVYADGPYRGHLQIGVIAPIPPSFKKRSDFPGAPKSYLPYDMQIGSGSWSVVPGIGGQVMNEVGSVGAQVRGVISVKDNSRGWRPGDRIEALIWVAHRFNDVVAASAGVRAAASNDIQGTDRELETLRLPGDLALTYGGNRVDLPVGFNFHVMKGPLAGQRIGVEGVWTVHEKVHGPKLASDWGITIGWQSTLDLPQIPF